MKEITAHENNDQQTCLSTTERKPNKEHTQTNLTKSSGTNKLHQPRTSATRCHITCTMGCGYVFIVPCLTTLDIKLNATTAMTETTAHLDADLHRHGTRTVNLVRDCRLNVHDNSQRSLCVHARVDQQRSGCWT